MNERCTSCKEDLGFYGDTNEDGLCLTCATARYQNAEAIIAKLPRTADGVPVTPGMMLWNKAAWNIPTVLADADPPTGKRPAPLNTQELYSTRAAAESIRGGVS